MESIVIYRDRQELQSADLTNSQEFARDSMDHVVKDAIDAGKGYTGFSVSKTAATEVTLSAGRLYAAGAVFARDESIVVDLFNTLPLVSKKRVALVAYGQEVETDVQPRDFLIDAQAGTTEPQSVAMENFRRAEISTVAGTESPDPAYPAVDAAMTVIAYVLLDTNGVVSIEQWKPTQLPNLRDLSDRTTSLEAWKTQISGQVETLRTDLAALADRAQHFALKSDIQTLTELLDQLTVDVYAPGAFVWYGTEQFLNDATSNTAHVDYDAIVEEGIRFPVEASSESAVSLLDPNNVFIQQDVGGGMIIPAYDHKLRMDLTGYSGETRLAQYTFETTTVRKLTFSRCRWRFGPLWSVYAHNIWWNNSYYDLAKVLFERDDENWEEIVGNAWRYYDADDDTPVKYPDLLDGAIVPNGLVWWQRRRWYWWDRYKVTYWDRVTTEETISGQQVAQTFLNSQDGWLTQLGLYFSRKADAGDVNVLICETKYGQPDLSRIVSRTTLAVEDIEVGAVNSGAGLPSLIETKVSLTPTYLTAGKRYAAVLITTGDHYVAMTNTDNGTVQGTFFVSTDGAFFSGNLVDDMKMRLYFAEFERSRVSVEVGAVGLAGGVSDIDILQEAVSPPACKTEVELQVNGAWVPMDGYPDGPDLSGLPALIPVRYTFTGTTDLMPAVVTTGSRVISSRSKTSFTWISEARNMVSPTTAIKVVVDLQGFDEAAHDCTISLLTGAALDGTEAADVVEDVTLNNGTIRRTATFNVTAVSDYAVKIVGAANSAALTYHVGEMMEYAQT